MNLRYILSVFIICKLSSCSVKSEYELCLQDANLNLTYQIVDTFQIDTSFSLTFNDWTTVKEEDNVLYYSILDSSSIYGIDLEKDSSVFFFNHDHLDKAVQDFYINEDVFLLTDYPYEMLQYRRGSDSSKVIFSLGDSVAGYSSPFNGDKLYINEERKSFQMVMFCEEEENFELNMYKRCNLDGKVQNSFCPNPILYEKYLFPLMDVPSKLDQDSISIFGFGYEHHLSKYNNITGKHLGNFCSRSNYIKQPIKGLDRKNKIEFQDESNEIIQSPFYLGLYYDEYRKCYYRIVKHRQPLKKNNYRLNSRYDGDWSIIVLDENLASIGEAKMPKNTYRYYSCFVGKKGFYVAFNEMVKKNAFAVININFDEKK